MWDGQGEDGHPAWDLGCSTPVPHIGGHVGQAAWLDCPFRRDAFIENPGIKNGAQEMLLSGSGERISSSLRFRLGVLRA